MNYTKIRYISIGLLLFCLTSMFGQPTNDENTDNSDPTFQSVKKEKYVKQGYLIQLHGGTLIFRLAIYGKKTKQLKKLLASDNISPKFRRQIEEELEETETQRTEENKAIIASFKNNYTFSEVYFIPDSLVGKLKEEEWEGIFLNDKMELDPTIELEKTDETFIGYIHATGGDNKFINIATLDRTVFVSSKLYNFWELMNYTGNEARFIPKAILRLEKTLYKNYDKFILDRNYIIKE